MALTTEARDEIATALTAAGILAFKSAPATVTMPSVIVVPAEPYLVVNRIGHGLSYMAAWDLTCIAQALDNESGLANVETLLDNVLAALPDGMAVTRVSRPMLDDFGAQGSGYVSQISVTAQLRG